jgi:surface antigen
MWLRKISFFLISLGWVASPAAALYEGLQCVPYARALTGIDIRGDAHSWWNSAAGLYERGNRPRVGAIMSFRPHGAMRLGHIAAVRKIIDKRTVLISHANWSTINGVRGHIENDVMVVDASDDNDWSRVKVWYSPNNALGTTEWPLNGFIYPAKTHKEKEERTALASLLQGRGRTTATSVQSKDVLTARTITQPQGFSLSNGLLSEIDRRARTESGKRR